MSFRFALRQVCFALLAIAIGLFAIALPSFFGIKRSDIPLADVVLCFMSLSVALGAMDEKPVGRGDKLLLWSILYLISMAVSAGLTHAVRFFFDLKIIDAYVAVGWGWGIFCAILIAVYWLTEVEDSPTNEVIKRGRYRVNEPRYLHTPEVKSAPGAAAPSNADEGDNNPEAYARFMTSTVEIPEHEFDPSYVYDASQPFRLPLRRDSKYRNLFVGGSDE